MAESPRQGRCRSNRAFAGSWSPLALALLALVACDDATPLSVCEGEPLVGLVSAYDSLTGRSYNAVGIDSVRLDGTLLAPDALARGDSRRLFYGDGALYCAIPCAFGGEPGTYSFRAKREDHRPATVRVAADPAGCAPGDSLAAAVSVPFASESTVRFRVDTAHYAIPADWLVFTVSQFPTRRVMSGAVLGVEGGELVTPKVPIRWDAAPVLFFEIRSHFRHAQLVVVFGRELVLPNRHIEVVVKLDTLNPFPADITGGRLASAAVLDLPGGTDRDSVFIVPYFSRIHDDWTW